MRAAWLLSISACLGLGGAQAFAQAAAGGAGGAGSAVRASVAAGGIGAAAAPAPQAGAGLPPPAEAGGRYVASCQQAIDRGIVNPGCQGPLYANEIARLKEDALRTNNPNLLTLLGDAYQSNRTGVSDIGQAYRWYLLGATRGDPRAMQRLSELYRHGQGAPQDNIKALGYARLTQRLAPPGSTSARQASEAAGRLGSDMAAEEVQQAERFANELESRLRSQGGLPSASAAEASAQASPSAPPREAQDARTLARLPGLGAASAQQSPRAPALGMPGLPVSTPATLPAPEAGRP